MLSLEHFLLMFPRQQQQGLLGPLSKARGQIFLEIIIKSAVHVYSVRHFDIKCDPFNPGSLKTILRLHA